MRFFSFCFFLFNVFYIKSSEDNISPIQQIINEMSDIHQKAQELFLESQIVNGKKSSIELAEELLGTTINVTLFKEYAEINTEKLKELKKPEKMSFEDKIKVIKAFHKLNDQVSMEQISDLVKGVIDRITLNLNQKKTAYKRFKELFEYIATRLDDFESVSQGGWRSEKALKTALQEAKDMILELDEVIEKPGKTKNLDTNVQIIQDFLLGELIKKLDELITIGINPLETVPLAEMESFLRYMEEFRDNLGFEFLEKVRETIDQIKEFEFPKEFILKYRNIDSVREFLLKVLRFAENVETKRIQLKNEWGAVPSGNLTSIYSQLKSCIDQYDFSIRFNETVDILHNLSYNLYWLDHYHYNIPIDWEDFRLNSFVQNLTTGNISLIDEEWTKDIGEARDLIEMIVTNTSGEAYTEFYRNSTMDNYLNVINHMKLDLSRVETLLKCHSELNFTMEHVNLVELAGDVWNFDLEGYLDFFKESHERLIEIEDWRIESDQKTFPLGEEEIKGVADGLEVLKALENIDVIMKMWEKLKKLENDMKWISAKTELKNVINRLPEQPIDSKLAYLHEGFSRIHSEFGYFLYESLKLQKMKKGVEKYEKWIKKQSCLVDGPKKCNNIPDELMKHVEL